jgi:hypothetical protein
LFCFYLKTSRQPASLAMAGKPPRQGIPDDFGRLIKSAERVPNNFMSAVAVARTGNLRFGTLRDFTEAA